MLKDYHKIRQRNCRSRIKSYESGSDVVLEGIRLSSKSGDNMLLKLDWNILKEN